MIVNEILTHNIQRHIRLNPVVYGIPTDLADFVSSKALVNLWSEFKRQVVICGMTAWIVIAHCHGYQLTELWKKKRDIYGVVKALAKETNLESTDAIWGHWAWVVCTYMTSCKQNISG